MQGGLDRRPGPEILEARLSIWDGAEETLCFSSGMTAICVLLLTFCSAGDVIVHSGPLYAASEGFVAKHMQAAPVTGERLQPLLRLRDPREPRNLAHGRGVDGHVALL